VEAKEGLDIQAESVTLASVSYQAFFRWGQGPGAGAGVRPGGAVGLLLHGTPAWPRHPWPARKNPPSFEARPCQPMFLQTPPNPTPPPPSTTTQRNFPKLAGMTGTAATEVSEFDGIYKLPVAVVPTNRAISRKDNPDVVFRLETYKWKAVVTEIARIHKEVGGQGFFGGLGVMGRVGRLRRLEACRGKAACWQPSSRRRRPSPAGPRDCPDPLPPKQGRPVLVGTTSVEKSELLSDMLTEQGVKHQVGGGRGSFSGVGRLRLPVRPRSARGAPEHPALKRPALKYPQPPLRC
jgi:hypothetical protein